MFSLKDSWLRMDRARYLLWEIYSHFEGYLDDDDEVVFPLKPVADYEEGSIQFVIERSPEQMTNLGVLVGEIIHNYRAALDYMWWQFACRGLGRTPDEKEAKFVQFPLVEKEESWSKNNKFFKFVSMVDVEHLKKFQPVSLDNGDGELVALKLFIDLSNRDKHRALNVCIFPLLRVNFHNNSGKVITMIPLDLDGEFTVGAVVGKCLIDLDGVDALTAVDTKFNAYIAESTSKVNILSFLQAMDTQCEMMLIESAKYF